MTWIFKDMKRDTSILQTPQKEMDQPQQFKGSARLAACPERRQANLALPLT